MTELPLPGVSAARVENLRDTLLTRIEALTNELDDADKEEMVQVAETIAHLSDAFVNLR
jgi:hypothetical protein